MVGRNVNQFQAGDEVFGESDFGDFAEFVSVTENKIVLKPASATFEEGAAIPIAAVSALQGLRDQGQIQPGQKVLTNGASGGVGTFAVQIAKSFGAEVTGVCSTSNLDLVRSIGANQVIDYTQEDFTQNGQRYDLIIDNVGNRSASHYKRALNPAGICVIIGYSSPALLVQVLFLGPWMSLTGSKKMGSMLTKINKEDLVFMKELFDAGEIVPVIDRRYPFREVPEAIRHLEKGTPKEKSLSLWKITTKPNERNYRPNKDVL